MTLERENHSDYNLCLLCTVLSIRCSSRSSSQIPSSRTSLLDRNLCTFNEARRAGLTPVTTSGHKRLTVEVNPLNIIKRPSGSRMLKVGSRSVHYPPSPGQLSALGAQVLTPPCCRRRPTPYSWQCLTWYHSLLFDTFPLLLLHCLVLALPRSCPDPLYL